MSSNSKFIINDDKTLADTLNNIIPSSNELDFLVGYFYFSGFKEIYQQTKEQLIKILVGLDVERTIQNEIREVNELRTIANNNSDKDIRDNFIKNHINLVNHIPYFDTPEYIEAWNMFVLKIKNNTLEIRKTRDPNHAKLYIFTNKPEFSQNGEFLGTVITGSSNLSISGLRDRAEIDVSLRDSHDYQDAKSIFNNLWDNSVPITTGGESDLFISAVKENTWLGTVQTPPTPYLMYVRVLDEYFKVNASDKIVPTSQITGDQYSDLSYQEDAVKLGISIIKANQGVLLTDVVGTGKSIVACAISYNLGNNLRTLVLCRPHLIKSWEEYTNQFHLNAKVYSSGNLEAAMVEDKTFKADIIIVDEAHQFRNNETSSYSLLHQLCQGKRVILLTATPFNNKPNDVFSLIKLFQIPQRSTLSINLDNKFQSISDNYNKLRKELSDKKITQTEADSKSQAIAKEMRYLIAPVTIRRSRTDLQNIKRYRDDLKTKNFQMSEVIPPIDFNYDLGDLSFKYQETLDKIMDFKGTRYKPTAYIVEGKDSEVIQDLGEDWKELVHKQANMAGFMKRLLVSRFESSIESFRVSLTNLINSSKTILDWYNKHQVVPIYKRGDLPDPEEITESDEINEDVVDQNLFSVKLNDIETLKEKGVKFISSQNLTDEFIEDLKNDINLLVGILQDWQAVVEDPKCKALDNKLEEFFKENHDRKIVIFSQYADTVAYLGNQLKNNPNFSVISYTASQENLRTVIRKDFDAGLISDEQTNKYNILVTTDALSEGINLHRAGIIINYDIPFNPMRVVQRVGRIDRINKKQFDKLYIYNSFPSETGANVVDVKAIAKFKIKLINEVLGADNKTLTAEDPTGSVYGQYNKYTEQVNEQSWDVDYRNEYDDIRINHQEVLTTAKNLPLKSRVLVQNNNISGIIVFGKKGGNYIFKIADIANSQQELIDEEGIGIFATNKLAKGSPASSNFYSVYKPLVQDLFKFDKNTKKGQVQNKAIIKIDSAIKEMPEESAYLNNLTRAAKVLNALAPYEYKQIQNFIEENKSLSEGIKQLKEAIPPAYLESLIQQAETIDNQEETIILSEEMIQ